MFAAAAKQPITTHPVAGVYGTQAHMPISAHPAVAGVYGTQGPMPISAHPAGEVYSPGPPPQPIITTHQVVAVYNPTAEGPMPWPNMPGAQSGYAKSADTLGVLATAPGGLYIQRQLQLATLLVGFEQRATLYCFNWNVTQDEEANPATTADFSDTILRMKEDSDCMVRFCIGSLRPFRMAVFPYSKSANYPPKEMDVFALPNGVTVERPFRLPILCLWRPLLRVRHNTHGYVADVRMPFTFVHPHFDILAPSLGGIPGIPLQLPKGTTSGQLLYKVRGDCCQGGMWFPNCPCICRKVKFMIFRAEDAAFSNPVGEIDRVFRDCCTAILEKDSFTARFPPEASPEMRLAILTSVLLVEMNVFEDRENKGFLCKLLDGAAQS